MQQPERRNFRLCLLLIRLQKGCAKHIYQQVSSLLFTLFSGMPVYLLYPSYEEDNEGHHHGGVGAAVLPIGHLLGALEILKGKVHLIFLHYLVD